MQQKTKRAGHKPAPRKQKRARRLAAICAAALACALAVPALLAQAEPQKGSLTQDGVTYSYQIEDGEATITHIAKAEGNTAETYEAVIPDTVEENGKSYLVVALADNVMGTTYKKSPTFTGSDTVVTDSALTRVVIPAKLLSIGDQAFAECLALKEVEFAAEEDGTQHLQSMGAYAFYQSAVADLQLPDTLIKVGEYAFAQMSGLQTVKLPATRTEWGMFAFYGTRHAQNFIIPEGVVVVPEITYDGSEINIPSTVEGEVNIEAKSATSVNVSPDANINDLTLKFAKCDKLEVPQTVTVLGLSGECPQVVFPENLRIISLYKVTGQQDVVIPASVEVIERGAFLGNESVKALSFEKGSKLKEIAQSAFRSSGLVNVQLPEGLAKLDMSAFYGCTALKRLDIPASVSEVSNYVEGCSFLETIEFAKNSQLPTIQRLAKDCPSLKQVVLPENAKSIIRGADAHFMVNCPKLETVIAYNPDLQLQESDFETCGDFKVYGWATEGNLLDFAESAGHEFVPLAELDGSAYNGVSNVKISSENGEKPQVVAQLSSVKGYNYLRLLTEGSDYSLTQVQQEGKACWQVQGNNETTFGTATVAIAAQSIEGAQIAPIATQLYSGTPCQPKPAVSLGGCTLVEGADYALSYANNAQPGTATVTATGIGAYTGSVSATFTVASALTVTRPSRTAGVSEAAPEKAETIVVAWAWDAAAVASASSFSATTGYPLVCVSNTGLTSSQVAQLGAWGTETAYVVGGLDACGQTVAEQLQQEGVTCQQVMGQTAAETSLALTGNTQAWGKVAVVANPEYSALAVAAGAFAGAANAPLVYTNPDGTLSAQALQVLQSFDQVIVVGDQFQVDAAAHAALEQPVRVSGNGDAATSLALASYAQKAGWYQAGPLYATSVASAPAQAAWAAVTGNAKAPFVLADLDECASVAAWAQANAQTVQGYTLLQSEPGELDALANLLQAAN